MCYFAKVARHRRGPALLTALTLTFKIGDPDEHLARGFGARRFLHTAFLFDKWRTRTPRHRNDHIAIPTPGSRCTSVLSCLSDHEETPLWDGGGRPSLTGCQLLQSELLAYVQKSAPSVRLPIAGINHELRDPLQPPAVYLVKPAQCQTVKVQDPDRAL